MLALKRRHCNQWLEQEGILLPCFLTLHSYIFFILAPCIVKHMIHLEQKVEAQTFQSSCLHAKIMCFVGVRCTGVTLWPLFLAS